MNKCIFKYIVVFIVLILILNILMGMVSIIPSKVIKNNVEESAEILINEDNFYRIFDGFNVINNNYTDALIINEAYSIDSKNPIYSYMTMRKNYNSEITKNIIIEDVGELISFGNSKEYDPVRRIIFFSKW